MYPSHYHSPSYYSLEKPENHGILKSNSSRSRRGFFFFGQSPTRRKWKTSLHRSRSSTYTREDWDDGDPPNRSTLFLRRPRPPYIGGNLSATAMVARQREKEMDISRQMRELEAQKRDKAKAKYKHQFPYGHMNLSHEPAFKRKISTLDSVMKWSDSRILNRFGSEVRGERISGEYTPAMGFIGEMPTEPMAYLSGDRHSNSLLDFLMTSMRAQDKDDEDDHSTNSEAHSEVPQSTRYLGHERRKSFNNLSPQYVASHTPKTNSFLTLDYTNPKSSVQTSPLGSRTDEDEVPELYPLVPKNNDPDGEDGSSLASPLRDMLTKVERRRMRMYDSHGKKKTVPENYAFTTMLLLMRCLDYRSWLGLPFIIIEWGPVALIAYFIFGMTLGTVCRAILITGRIFSCGTAFDSGILYNPRYGPLVFGLLAVITIHSMLYSFKFMGLSFTYFILACVEPWVIVDIEKANCDVLSNEGCRDLAYTDSVSGEINSRCTVTNILDCIPHYSNISTRMFNVVHTADITCKLSWLVLMVLWAIAIFSKRVRNTALVLIYLSSVLAFTVVAHYLYLNSAFSELFAVKIEWSALLQSKLWIDVGSVFAVESTALNFSTMSLYPHRSKIYWNPYTIFFHSNVCCLVQFVTSFVFSATVYMMITSCERAMNLPIPNFSIPNRFYHLMTIGTTYFMTAGQDAVPFDRQTLGLMARIWWYLQFSGSVGVLLLDCIAIHHWISNSIFGFNLGVRLCRLLRGTVQFSYTTSTSIVTLVIIVSSYLTIFLFELYVGADIFLHEQVHVFLSVLLLSVTMFYDQYILGWRVEMVALGGKYMFFKTIHIMLTAVSFTFVHYSVDVYGLGDFLWIWLFLFGLIAMVYCAIRNNMRNKMTEDKGRPVLTLRRILCIITVGATRRNTRSILELGMVLQNLSNLPLSGATDLKPDQLFGQLEGDPRLDAQSINSCILSGYHPESFDRLDLRKSKLSTWIRRKVIRLVVYRGYLICAALAHTFWIPLLLSTVLVVTFETCAMNRFDFPAILTAENSSFEVFQIPHTESPWLPFKGWGCLLFVWWIYGMRNPDKTLQLCNDDPYVKSLTFESNQDRINLTYDMRRIFCRDEYAFGCCAWARAIRIRPTQLRHGRLDLPTFRESDGRMSTHIGSRITDLSRTPSWMPWEDITSFDVTSPTGKIGKAYSGRSMVFYGTQLCKSDTCDIERANE